VLIPASYNGRAGMIVCCPTTTRIKDCPFEAALAGTPPSVVLADQVKSQDWRARKAARKGRVSAAELAKVRAKLIAQPTRARGRTRRRQGRWLCPWTPPKARLGNPILE